VESSCERGYEPSGSIKCWETIKFFFIIPVWLHNWWPLEYFSVPYSKLVRQVSMLVNSITIGLYTISEY
jgi:hypothetical protein